jgi:hypothetical protein
MYSTYLKQIFCDGSVVNYHEESPKSPGAYCKLIRWGVGQDSETKVSHGYLQAKIEFLRATGNEHKILKKRIGRSRYGKYKR